MKNKRILVIGSNSFSGAHFACGARVKGHEVFGISRSLPPKKPFMPNTWHYKNDVEYPFQKLDLNNDLSEIESLVDKFKPSHVVNFAAQGMVAESWKTPVDWYKTNLFSQVKLHEK